MTQAPPTTPAPLSMAAMLGQDFASVYNSGEKIIRQPIESSTIYLISVILAACIEYLFEMAGRINSKFFHNLFSVQISEALVFGATILLLIFFSSFTSDFPENWAVAFAMSEMAVVFMMIWYLGLTSAVAGLTAKLAKQLESFETTRMGGGGDQQEDLKPHEILFSYASIRFKMSMLAFGYEKPLVFAQYMFRVQKKLLCGLGDLSWKVWLSMTLPTVFNAVRAGAMDGAEESGNASIAVFIFWQGGLPILLFLVCYRKLTNGVRTYLEKDREALAFRVKALDANYADTAEADVEPFTREEMLDPKQFLILSSLENTLTLIQISLVQITWYCAIHIVTMYQKIFAQNGGISFVLFCGSLIPPVIFVWLMPWCLTVITFLSSLETELKEDFVAACYTRLEKDGLAKLLVVTNQAAEDEKKKQEYSVNNTTAIQAALDAKLADEAAKAKKDDNYDESGRPLAKRMISRPLNIDDDALARMSITRRRAMLEREDD